MSSFCLGCGNSMQEDQRFCGVCGRDSQSPAVFRPVDPAVAFGLPPETSGKAIFSFVAGLLFIILPFSVVAIVFGYLALSEIRKTPGRWKGKGLAITGIVLGYIGAALLVGLIGLGIYGIVERASQLRSAAKANTTQDGRPSLTHEMSAISTVRTLNTAEIAYSQAHHDIGYTCSLSELSSAWGINPELAQGRKNGYVFSLKGCTADKRSGPIVKYQVVAYPLGPVNSTRPAYCSDQTDVIRVARSGSAEDCLKKGEELSEREIKHPAAYSKTAQP